MIFIVTASFSALHRLTLMKLGKSWKWKSWEMLNDNQCLLHCTIKWFRLIIPTYLHCTLNNCQEEVLFSKNLFSCLTGQWLNVCISHFQLFFWSIMTLYKRMNSKKKSREFKLSLFPIPISQIEQQNCRIAGIKQLQNLNGKLGSINFPIAWLIWVHFCISIFLFFQTDLKYVVKLLFFFNLNSSTM